MAFLDKKERILDIVLTEEGRKLLAQNDLDFAYYAFSDDGIDYSGSLNASRQKNIKLEEYIPSENLFEAFSKNDSINYHIYTNNPNEDKVPVFTIEEESVNSNLSFSIERQFVVEEPEDFISKRRGNAYYSKLGHWTKGAIKRASATNKSERDRKREKAYEDLTNEFTRQLSEENIQPGIPLGEDYIALNQAEAIDRRSGGIIPLSSVSLSKKIPESDLINQKIEVILNTDELELNFLLKNADREVESKGFLIEIYSSGSDGKVQKLPAEDIFRDDETEEIKIEGFLNYIEILTDEER